VRKGCAAIPALVLALAGCGGSADEGAAPATVTVTQLPSSSPPLDPHECQDPAVAEANPELCGDAMFVPPESTAEDGAEWPDGFRAEIVSITPRPYDDTASVDEGDRMLSIEWRLTNTGTAGIPMNNESGFAEEQSFGVQFFYGANRMQAPGYIPNEGNSCQNDLPQRLVPGSSETCFIDFLIESAESNELRAEVFNVGQPVILTGIERMAPR